MNDATLKFRLLAGGAFFLFLAVFDLYRHGRHAQRWREYLFLLLAVALAMLYGAANDQISSRISWEYFYYGKELAPILGPQTPPAAARLHWQAARIGIEATWSAGLIAGAVLLFVNSMRIKAGRRPLGLWALAMNLLLILPICVATGVLFAGLGHAGDLNWMSPDFRDLAATNLWRPKRFMTTYGLHLGGYVGGLIGLIVAGLRTWLQGAIANPTPLRQSA